MRLILPFDGRDTIKVQIDYAIDYELNPVHYAFTLAITLVEIAGVRPNSFIDGFPSVRYMCEKLGWTAVTVLHNVHAWNSILRLILFLRRAYFLNDDLLHLISYPTMQCT